MATAHLLIVEWMLSVQSELWKSSGRKDGHSLGWGVAMELKSLGRAELEMAKLDQC